MFFKRAACTLILACSLPAMSAEMYKYERPSELKQCVHARGNGERMPMTMAALARLTEQYGFFDAIVGRSSGSGVSFIYESMLLNPHIWNCGASKCNENESRARMALLLKSMQGYIEVFAKTEEVQSIVSLKKSVETLIAEVTQKTEEESRKSKSKDWKKIAKKVKGILKNARILNREDDVKNVLDEEFVNLAIKSHAPGGDKAEFKDALPDGGIWKRKGNSLLFGPKLIDFDQIVTMIGRLGNFYATYGPANQEAWQKFMQECSNESLGKTWQNIDTSCKEQFGEMATNYRKEVRAIEKKRQEGLLGKLNSVWKDPTNKQKWKRLVKSSPDSDFVSREDEVVGKYMNAFVSTSTIRRNGIKKEYLTARKNYKDTKREDRERTTFMSFNFDKDVKAGFFGPAEALETVAKNKRNAPNVFTAHKVIDLDKISGKQTTWREAMRRSAGEPGLTSIQPLTKDVLTSGGWYSRSGGFLKNMGCEKVFYATRKGKDSRFGVKVAKLLGANDTKVANFYSFDHEDSHTSQSVKKYSDVVMCTNWDSDEGKEELGILGHMIKMIDEAYTAPIVLKSNADKTGYGNEILDSEITNAQRMDATQFKGCSIK